MLKYVMFAAGGEGGGGIPHIANYLWWLSDVIGLDTPLGKFIHTYEDLFFAGALAALLCFIARLATRNITDVPKGTQNFVEILVDGITNFVCNVMGKENGRIFAPFIGSLFFYIWIMNLAGLVPGMKSPTANLNTALGLGLAVFLAAQFIGIRSFGIKGYLLHMMESPKDIMMLVIGIFFIFPVHFIGEFVKPLSLAMRLGFNITGEDAFLAVAVGFGPMGLILQLMAIGLGLILGTAQALVFSTLSAVFISMVLPHEEHH